MMRASARIRSRSISTFQCGANLFAWAAYTCGIREGRDHIVTQFPQSDEIIQAGWRNRQASAIRARTPP
jgi:hypothetical protein